MTDLQGIEAKGVSRVDYWTHLVFPARTLIKDMIYWPAEIAAGVFFFIWVLQMELETIPAMGDMPEYKVYKVDDNKQPINMLEMREYGWICLCYTIKHLIYIADTVMLMGKKLSTPIDVLVPVVNFIMWGLWMLYGFLNVGGEIYIGIQLRIAKDQCKYREEKTQASFDDCIRIPEEVYKATAKWTWLWIVPAIACVVNLALWFLGGIKKRSSAFTNVAVSTWLIPLNLFWYHFFLKSWWISSNTKFYAENPPKDFSERAAVDTFDTRYVFPIVYFGSWIGLLFAIICVYRAGLARSFDVKDTVKFILYAVFFVSGFIWCLFIDATIYHSIIRYQIVIIITHIICLVAAVIIGAISIMQKQREGDLYYARHQNYANWK